MVFKPHNSTVLDISFCPTCPLFATTGADGTIFFFDTNSGLRGSNWAPLKFVRIAPPMDVPGRTLPPTASSSHKIVCEKISWRRSSDMSSASNDSTFGIIAGTGTETDTAVCCCSDGVMREFSVGHLVNGTTDSREVSELSTYETTVNTVERVVRVPLGFSLPPPPSAPISLSVRSNSVALSSPIGATASMPMSPVQPGKESSCASQVRTLCDPSVLCSNSISSFPPSLSKSLHISLPTSLTSSLPHSYPCFLPHLDPIQSNDHPVLLPSLSPYLRVVQPPQNWRTSPYSTCLYE
jgi:hypothetical protein